MKYLRPPLAALLIFVSPFLLTDLRGRAHAFTGQDADKTLDIARYTVEPLKLVALKVGERDLKNSIAIKSRRDNGGVDTVTFKDQDGWFRRVQIQLRNVSNRSIHGVSAHLYFHPSFTTTLYSLPLAGSTPLKQGVLEPGADITLTVTEQAWNLTSDILLRHNINPDLSSVSFDVDMVQFGDDLRCSRGSMLRSNPANPNMWIPISPEKDTPD